MDLVIAVTVKDMVILLGPTRRNWWAWVFVDTALGTNTLIRTILS